MSGPNMPPVKSQYFPLSGGLDAESAQLSLRPGVVIGALNYESSALEGYERIAGFERFDGRPRPSDAAYRVFQCNAGFVGVAAGQTINGQTSGATAKVMFVRGTTQLVITRVTGTWQYAENVRVGTTVVGVLDADGSDFTGLEENDFLKLCAADYRADIGAVPGSGPLRGLAALNDVLYAWRDNAGVTACEIYKSTGAGWVLVPFYKELAFTAGSGTIPAEGATITKGAVSAVVKRVVTQSGSWTAGTAVGRFIIATPTGGSFTAGAFSAGVTATAGGAEAAITMLPGGRLDMAVYNFTGLANRQRIYGADGVNRGFEFDGDVMVPIVTGMALDKPIHCVAHRSHLFFSFAGSIQNSAIADPYQWSAVLGAAEITLGDVCTGFQVLPSEQNGGALMVFTPSRTWVLYGSSSADWQLTNFADAMGAQRWSVQSLGRILMFDTLGVSSVSASQSFGNFDRLPMSERIQRFLHGKLVLASVVNRTLNRMRVFFTSGDSLSITPVPTQNGEMLAFMPINYGKTVWCTCAALMAGEHRNFWGSDDGYVYEADRGRSFDGAEIFAYLKLSFNHVKSPLEKKRFRRVDLESKTRSACRMLVQGEYSLGQPDIGLTSATEIERGGEGAYFDLTNYDESYYDTPRHAINRVRLDGVGTSLSLSVVSQSDKELSHTLQSASVLYTPRRIDR